MFSPASFNELPRSSSVEGFEDRLNRVINGELAGFCIVGFNANSGRKAMSECAQMVESDALREQLQDYDEALHFERSAKQGFSRAPQSDDDWRRMGYEPLHADGVDPGLMPFVTKGIERTLSVVWVKNGSFVIRMLRRREDRTYLNTLDLQDKITEEPPLVDVDQFEDTVDQITAHEGCVAVFDATRHHYSKNLVYPRASKTFLIRVRVADYC